MGTSFEGIPATAWRPPDNTCAVGPEHVMLAVNTDLAVYAKTGTLRWANSLSGYVTTAAGEHLVFSIMLNRFVPGTNTSAREAIDFLVTQLADFSGRSDR